MDPKLTLLFALIAVVIGLSYLTEENLRRMRRPFVGGRWRQLTLLRRKI